MRVLFLVALLSGCSLQARAELPDCSQKDAWAVSMAFVHLKNAAITKNELVDFDKTEVRLLATEKVDEERFRQVQLVTFTEKSGARIEVITMNDASNEECSLGDVEVFLVSRKLP